MSLVEKFEEHYKEKLVRPGNGCCPGCGGSLAWRMLLEALGKNTVLYGGAPCAGCAMRVIKLPRFGFHFSFVGDGASGIAAAFKVKGREDITVFSSAGDGGVGDISFGKVSACAERNDNFIQCCIDNEAYMNTGIQKSGLTPYGAWTTTTPTGKKSKKKMIPMILAQHRIPYLATLSIAYPQDLMKKVRKAKEIRGFRYLHLVMPCPTGWRFPASKTVEVARLAVQTWIWPLYEVEKGILRLTMKPKQRPVEDYLRLQGRFRHLTEDEIAEIQRSVDEEKERLLERDGKNIWL
ncbi:pyruvate synthase subunit beta [Candidatus Bathyarchaeota archaeon]|nr:MAG: pyruvate synthase subunit beta [Candidatus Bathyarchaeota archaeon]RLI33677.1 MAG: pyruvate synthase subunit beta [Candidatus Bathyarchaeota archaeon]